MKSDFPYKEGDLVEIFSDYENNLVSKGTAKLVKFNKLGRSFILEETMPESEQIVHNYQEWLVEWPMPDKFTKMSVEKIRFVDTIGIANSAVEEDYDAELEKLPKDTFITIHGIEVY